MALRRLQQCLISELIGIQQQQTCVFMRPAGAPLLAPLSLQHGFRTSAQLLDFYSVLGVPRTANDSEIKKAFYQLAKKYHPDTNQGDPEAAKKFQEVQRAYDTLRDSQKRQAYDSMGHAAYEQMEAGGGTPGDQGPFPGGGVEVDAEELFREFFGGGRGGRGGFQGASMFEHIFGGGFAAGQRMHRRPMLHAMVHIPFEEAVKGATRTLELSSLGIPGAAKKTVELRIPAGVDSGSRLRLDGVAQGSRGSPPTDLIVELEVAPSPVFERQDFNLYVDVPISMVDACLGTSVDVPTIDGRAEVKVKPGTQPGDKLRMRGYGVRMDAVGQSGRRGDQFVRIVVTVPRGLTADQRRLLEEFRSGSKSSSGSTSSSNSSSSGSGGTSKEEKPKKRGWFS